MKNVIWAASLVRTLMGFINFLNYNQYIWLTEAKLQVRLRSIPDPSFLFYFYYITNAELWVMTASKKFQFS